MTPTGADAAGEPVPRNDGARVGRRRFAPAAAGAQGAIAFAVYSAIAFWLWGVRLLPHLSAAYLSGPGTYSDVRLTTWSLAWWPHALGNGLNPLHAAVVWAPHGVNATWMTGMPGPSLLLTPVTLALGPVASENLLFLAAPPLAAWGAYLLCRRCVRAFLPALVGGYLFGFSTYVVGQMRGHLNLVLVFPVPLCAYLIVRRMQGSMPTRRFVLLLSLTLLLEFSISTETFATTLLFGAIAFAVSFASLPRPRRQPLIHTAGAAAIACALACLVASPFLAASLRGAPSTHFSANGSWTSAQVHDYVEHYSTDLLSYVVPRGFVALRFTEATGLTSRFVSNSHEDGAYLGVPLLVLLAVFAVARRRRRSTWLLVSLFLVAVVLSLGPTLHVAGHGLIALPWALATKIPGLREALPIRLSLYAWLIVAVVVAIWLAEARRRAWMAWIVALLSVVAIFPLVPRPSDAPVPAFFAGGAYTRYLHHGETVLAIPAFAPSDFMAWQAATWYGFDLAMGYVGFRAIPGESQAQPGFYGIVTNRPSLVSPAALAEFARSNHVGAVIVPDAWERHWSALIGTLGPQPVHVDGFWVYTLPGTG